MTLNALPSKLNLKGKRVFLRVDWNVPVRDGIAAEDSLKISRTIETIKNLSSRGAIVLVATHLGRPKKREKEWSTRPLVKLIAKQYRVPMVFWDELLAPKKAKPGDVYLLENVRFNPGEETNDAKLAKQYAAMAHLFVNDAFASCHRSHASVTGVAKQLKSYAGPTLGAEVAALERLITKPKRPFVAVLGGAKVTDKIGVIEALAHLADRVLIGGAMATAFLAAQKRNIGKSFVEKEGIAIAKKLVKNPKIVLPADVVVAPRKIRLGSDHAARAVRVADIKSSDAIGDIGPETMRMWSQEVKNAQTIVWNGPLGVTEIPAFSHGSLVVGQSIAIRSKGLAYGVVGGGDTLPVIVATGMSEWVDHLSTGGGAMLEFIAKKGKLPGLLVLQKK